VSATSAHAAAASSTATASVLCQRVARSGDGRRLAGLAWPSSPPRAPEWSILPTHTGCARQFLERNEAPVSAAGATGRARGSSRTRWRRILAVAWSGHRWCEASATCEANSSARSPSPGVASGTSGHSLRPRRSDDFQRYDGERCNLPAAGSTGPDRSSTPPVDSQAPRAVGACGSCLLGEGTIGHR